MKAPFIKLLFILVISVVLFIPLSTPFSELIEWKRQQAYARTINAWCSHNNLSNRDWRLYCAFKGLCGTSCYDKISNKNKHLSTAEALADRICNSPTARSNILGQGLLESTLNLYEHARQTPHLRESDYIEFNSWISEQCKEMAETGETKYLFQDHDYWVRMDKIEQRVCLALTPPPVSEEEHHALFAHIDERKNAFFNNLNMPSPQGDGMSIKTPLDLRHTEDECITILLKYIHEVLHATTIRILPADDKDNKLYKTVLFDKNSKKSFYLYILANPQFIDKYTIL